MSPARRDVVEEHLSAMEQALSVLDRHHDRTTAELEADFERLLAVEHALQLAVQSALDVGAHVLAAHFGEHYDEYREIPARLAARGVVDGALGAELAALAGVRNVLVHHYLRVRVDLLREHVRAAPARLRRLAQALRALLDA
ncbi:MAG: HepT-like ribonuclease domain-containing protein [Myxococcota bacterium]